MSPGLLVVAGEASGDLHGARLLQELGALCPDLSAFGLGGDEMRATGFEALAHSAEISVVGITEALKILRRARQIFHALLDEVDRRGTRSAVLIDFPEFNMRLAKALKQRGVQVFYYISPQIWAWRRWRVKTIARTVDRMLVLFPFEVELYHRSGVAVEHVGHPLVDEVPQYESVWERPRREGEPYVLALLPGSRVSEVKALLPSMLGAVEQLAAQLPVRADLIEAPTVPSTLYDELLAAHPALPIERVHRDRFRAVAQSHLALCASGTATLEVGLLGTPLIVLYRLTRWSYLLGRMLVRLPYFSLVNLVLGERAVPELLQGETEPGRVAARAAVLLTDEQETHAMRQRLARLRPALGASGASQRAAAAIAAGLSLAASGGTP